MRLKGEDRRLRSQVERPVCRAVCGEKRVTRTCREKKEDIFIVACSERL